MDQTNTSTPTVPNFPPEPTVAMPMSPLPDSASAIPPSGLPPQMPPMSAATPEGGGSKKMMMIIVIIILILAIAGVGGWYYMYGISASPTDTEQEQTTEQSTKTQSDLTNLGKETEGVEIIDPNEDLVEVDKEINLLESTASAIKY